MEEANTCLRELELLVTLLNESTYLMPHLKSAGQMQCLKRIEGVSASGSISQVERGQIGRAHV